MNPIHEQNCKQETPAPHPHGDVLSLLRDRPIDTLPEILSELELAMVPLRTLRDQIVEEPWSDQVTTVLGLYLRHAEALIAKAQMLMRQDKEG